jgi:MoaA/NifB/PqqE/SkfB family radical SAM enzyme
MLNTLNFHITNNCNFRCKHCLYSSWENKITEMSFDEITNLIDQFHEICDWKWTINLYWWEVFMRKDIFKIFNYIKSKWLKIGLTSNMNFTEDFLQKIYDLNLSRYTLNLDWWNNKSHDWLRNEKWHFDKTIQIIKELKILWKYVAINSVLHKNNISEIIDILKLCKSLKIDAISFYLFTFLGRWYKIKDLMIWAKDWLETKKKIEKWIAKNNPSFIIIWERSYASKWELRNLSSCLCEWYEHEVIDVACDWNIYYCWLLLSVKGNSLWNIKNQNLKEILKNREKMNLRNKIWCAALAIQENWIKKLIDPRESFGNIIPICPYDWEILQWEKTTAKNKFIHIS